MRALSTLAAVAALTAMGAAAAEPDVARLRAAALEDRVAWEIAEGLTTEVGARLAGTEAEERARQWAVAKLRALGFANVRIETFQMPVWVRGAESAEIVSPFPQKLVLTALGNSGATPAAGITAEVVGFDTVEQLAAASDSDVRGRIVFVSHAMARSQDGSGYSYYGGARRQGPSIASRKGAAGIVIRSIGTGYHRHPHTGWQGFEPGVREIPAAALSLPDAEQLQRILQRGRPVTLRLLLTPRKLGMRESGNVIAEVPGSDPAAGLVLVGGHLDSWDLGTGAIDDAAGLAVTTAAARRVMEAGQPRRTIRIVWFGAEEVDLVGATDYLARHGKELHAAVAESDFGADRVWRFDSRMPASAQPAVDRIARALAPLGISKGPTNAASGSDISVLTATGVSGLQLRQDGTRYFDLHHTPDDTLDKIDRAQLQQNVAAWTVMIALAANAPEDLAAPR